MNLGEAGSDSTTATPTTAKDAPKPNTPSQSLVTINSNQQTNEKGQSNQQGKSASTVQVQVLNTANAESKGTSINQHKAAVRSTSSLVQDDLKLLDKEIIQKPKPAAPSPAPTKVEQPKPVQEKPK